LNRLPDIKRVIDPRECGSQFIIIYNLATEDTENTERGEAAK
jgi:hypothetical protein